jgi:hypothetical protein
VGSNPSSSAELSVTCAGSMHVRRPPAQSEICSGMIRFGPEWTLILASVLAGRRSGDDPLKLRLDALEKFAVTRRCVASTRVPLATELRGILEAA